MSQHDGVIDNAAGATVRSDINDALAAVLTLSSGATAPSTTYANMWWVDTTTNTLKRRDNANTAWKIIASLDAANTEAKSATFTIGDDDIGKFFPCTGTYTINFNAVSVLTDSFWCVIKNNGTGTLTLDPASTEQIDGATTKALGPGDSAFIWCNGSSLTSSSTNDILAASNSWSKPQRLTDTAETTSSGVATIDVQAQPSSTVTVSENITSIVLSNKANLTDGDIIKIWFIQNVTGGYTITGWESDIDFGDLGEPAYPTVAYTGIRMVFEVKTINSTKALRFLGSSQGYTD